MGSTVTTVIKERKAKKRKREKEKKEMTIEKRLDLVIVLAVLGVALLSLLVKVIEMRLEFAILISAGISIFLFFKLHAFIEYMIERKR